MLEKEFCGKSILTSAGVCELGPSGIRLKSVGLNFTVFDLLSGVLLVIGSPILMLGVSEIALSFLPNIMLNPKLLSELDIGEQLVAFCEELSLLVICTSASASMPLYGLLGWFSG